MKVLTALEVIETFTKDVGLTWYAKAKYVIDNDETEYKERDCLINVNNPIEPQALADVKAYEGIE
jgi:hypothetical protein